MARSPVIGSFLVSAGKEVLLLKKKKRDGKFRPIRLENGRFLPVILYAALSALMFILLFFHVRPESLDLDLFSISENTIYAPATVEDQKATANKKQEAREEVPDQYTLKKSTLTTGSTLSHQFSTSLKK